MSRGLLHAACAAVGVGVLFIGGAANAGITADSVVSYTPGDFSITGSSTSYQDASAAVGPLTGDTTYGGLNPFNPAFDPSQIVIIGAGGSLTLHLLAAVATTGATLGVFSNNGFFDVSVDGSGMTSSPAATLSDYPEAVVKVSQDGTHFVALNGGNPITFDNPTNYYLDGSISDYYEPLGAQVANQFQPFLGSTMTGSFDGATFAAIKSTLDGSAGGNWLDLSGTGLSSIDDVEFDVPAEVPYRMVVDSVSGIAVPEPASVGLAAMVLVALYAGRSFRPRRPVLT